MAEEQQRQREQSAPERGESAPRPPRRFGGGGGRSFPRRKVCGFCVDGIKHVDYKDVPRIRRYISDRGMIEPRRKMGTCAKHQRSLTTAIKRARHLAMLSFTEGAREPRERGGRGDRDRGRGRFQRDREFSRDREFARDRESGREREQEPRPSAPAQPVEND
jgi:small subunit ribosomal protein S18